MVHVHVQLHHLINVEGLDAAAGGHANGVANEGESVVVFQEFRVLGENGAFLRVVAICFQSHETFFTSAREKFVHHF